MKNRLSFFFKWKTFWFLLAIFIVVLVIPALLGDRLARWTDPADKVTCGYRVVPMGFEELDCNEPIAPAQTKLKPIIGESMQFISDDQSDKLIGQMYIASGEKSVVAGNGLFMSAAVVQNRDDTLVKDGTSVEFVIDGKIAATTQTKGGVASAIFEAPTQAGMLEVAARVGNNVAMGNTIRVVPAEPVMLQVQRAKGSGPVNDGEEIWFETKPMMDQYGNRLDDGGLVHFAGTDVSGRKLLLHGVVVNGIATAKIINRHIGQKISLIGRHKDIAGPPVEAEFAPVILPPRLTTFVTKGRGLVNLEIGPLNDSLGRYIKNGMPFELILPDGRVLEEVTNFGYLEFKFTDPRQSAAIQVILVSGDQKWSLVLDEQSSGPANFVLSGNDQLALGD